MMRSLVALAVLAMLAGGCGQFAASPPAAASQPAPPNQKNSRSISWSEPQMLCLADPSGSSNLDRELGNLQLQVKALPGKADGWIQAGRQWIRKARLTSDPGFYLNARGCADEALRIHPDDSHALGLRALAMMNDHRFRDALAVADDILRRDPENLIALGVRSDAWLELGDVERSAFAAQQMLDIKPDMASYSRASYIRWLKGDFDSAVTLIRHALEGRDIRDPEPAAWTFVQAGMLFWNAGDYAGADLVFAESLKWVPDYPAALVGRARAALSLQQPQPALEYLTKAYRIHPLPETAWMLGDARAMLGDLEGAEKEYGHVIREGRKSDRLTLAQFYASRNRSLEEALALIEEERKARENIFVDDAYAWALYRLGRFEEAKTAIDRALRYGTRDARLLYHAGAIRMAAGDSRGRKIVEDALKMNPNFDWLAVAEARNLLAISYAKK